MNNYTNQLAQARAKDRVKKIAKKAKSKIQTQPIKEITGAEWMLIAIIALIADLLGPFGFIFAVILIIWYYFKFNKFPTKKLIGSGAAEIVSVGILPGWLGFVISAFLEQKGISLPMKKAFAK